MLLGKIPGSLPISQRSEGERDATAIISRLQCKFSKNMQRCITKATSEQGRDNQRAKGYHVRHRRKKKVFTYGLATWRLRSWLLCMWRVMILGNEDVDEVCMDWFEKLRLVRTVPVWLDEFSALFMVWMVHFLVETLHDAWMTMFTYARSFRAFLALRYSVPAQKGCGKMWCALVSCDFIVHPWWHRVYRDQHTASDDMHGQGIFRRFRDCWTDLIFADLSTYFACLVSSWWFMRRSTLICFWSDFDIFTLCWMKGWWCDFVCTLRDCMVHDIARYQGPAMQKSFNKWNKQQSPHLPCWLEKSPRHVGECLCLSPVPLTVLVCW